MGAALQRIEKLFDPGSFEFLDDLLPSIHILGAGKIAGRRAYCCAGNPETRQADLRECFLRKIRWMEKIIENPAPVVWLHDCPPQTTGGRTPIPPHSDELLASNTAGVGRAFCLQARLNGVVPQLAALFNDAGAAQAFPVRLSDLVALKRGTHLWIGRPDAVRLMLGSAPDPEKLGGADMHCKVSGVGDFFAEDEDAALGWMAGCLAMLPSRAGAPPPLVPARPPELPAACLADFIPPDLNKPFDMRPVLRGLIDSGSWVGVRELYAPESITGFARIAGVPIGVLANDSSRRGGVIYPETCRKMTAFIRLCDTYRIPLLFLADNPGLIVGEMPEQAGMLLEACELLRALASLKTPRVCLVIRKAYTVGLYAMAGPGFDPDAFWAAPGASVSVFGPKALDCFAADRGLAPAVVAAIQAMRDNALDPRRYVAAGLLGAVIEWKDMRERLEQFCLGGSAGI